MAQKFIINNNELIMGDVIMHEDLLKNKKRNKTIGGGYWYIHEETNTMYFYGKSIDFGKVTEEQFNKAKKNILSDKKFNIKFTTEENLVRILNKI